jgi:hypothetical protein
VTFGTMNRPARHISFWVPQPGRTGSLALWVSYVAGDAEDFDFGGQRMIGCS